MISLQGELPIPPHTSSPHVGALPPLLVWRNGNLDDAMSQGMRQQGACHIQHASQVNTKKNEN